MENGRIVYNRQYGNIPEGSHTGGSTYTVKSGDTLYIARLPGNDFRDSGPEKQHTSAPYSLNVGKLLQLVTHPARQLRRKCDHLCGCAASKRVATRSAIKFTAAVAASQPTITYS